MDIAVHAGRICRYGGAVWMPLLAHLVFVGLMAHKRSLSVKNMLWGFLHDAHEIATSDVPRPFKCECMRKEQRALDGRIFKRFARPVTGWNQIDHDLIKQCDIDACHIEATMLGLPHFGTVELLYGADYTNAKKIHDAVEDKELFQRIYGSPFYNDVIDGVESEGVRNFGHMLLLAELGDQEKMIQAVNGWDLW